MIPEHWHIFPVNIDKTPATPNGHLDARPAAEWRGPEGSLISQCRSHPDNGWAVSCAASGLLVVDIDPRNGGDRSFDELIEKHGHWPETLTAYTGGGGLHFYFQKPDVPKFRKTLAHGIDIKVNGYVVIPPSMHASGRPYEWANQAPIAELPAWALALVVPFVPDDQYQRTGDAATCFLARAFDAAGMLGREIDPDRVCVRCPWELAHTAATSDSSTIIFGPTETHPLGRFWCSHTSHGNASAGAVLDALPVVALAKAVRV